MKLRYLTLLLLPLLLLACKEEPQGPSMAAYQELAFEKDSLARQIDELQNIIGAVTTSLDSIDTQENLLFVNNDDGSKATRKQMLERIAAYKELLARQREQLQELEKNDKAAMRQLRTVIARLREEITEKEMKIQTLEQEVASNKRDIAALKQTLNHTLDIVDRTEQQRDSLRGITEDQDIELNTVYYIVGTRNQLKQAGIVKGAFRSKVDYANINRENFIRVDKRRFTELTIHGKSVKLISEKPADSYNLVETSNGTTILRITDAQKFWSTSPYLIIQNK